MLVIGIYEKSIKFLDFNKEKKISFAHNLTDSFSIESICNQNKSNDLFLNDIADNINNILLNSKTTSHTSKVLFDTNLCFTTVIPLDFNESLDKIKSNILWELSNYFPESYKNYKISYHKLLSNLHSNNIKETLIIGVKINLLDAVKKLSKLLNVKINSINIEHFASEKYYKTIRRDMINNENILIIGCKKNRIDYSIINNSGCIAYDYLLLKDINYQEYIIKSFQKIKEKYNELRINNIYLYGDESIPSIYKIINEVSKETRLILSNPFYEFGITDSINSEIVSEGYNFVPLCGLAINSQ